MPSSPRVRAAARARSEGLVKLEAAHAARWILARFRHEYNAATNDNERAAAVTSLETLIGERLFHFHQAGRGREREMLRGQGRLEARRRG